MSAIFDRLNQWWQSAQLPAMGQSLSFPLEITQTEVLGEIRQPIVMVSIWSDVFNQWRTVRMFVDTGADYTLLPRYMGAWFSADRNASNAKIATGLGGTQQVHFLEGIKIKLGPFDRTIPVGVATTNAIPPLMGRHQFFETFKVEFDYQRQVTFWG